jgi:pullulanase
MRNWNFSHIDFSTYPTYTGNDLGMRYSPKNTVIKVWSPVAKKITLRIYTTGEGGYPIRIDKFSFEKNGVWKIDLRGDYHGMYYTIQVFDGQWLDEIPDMYAKAVGVNGKRALVADMHTLSPKDWEKDQGPHINSITDCIIYETHVRDFSIAADSGMKYKGKFLAFTERGSQNAYGQPTGLDHLKELGMTHVHLLPVNDYQTVDEKNPDKQYNWGYDPLHFHALEGSYATNPYDGRIRIKEFKALVQSLHEAGIGVILDMVLNHTYFTRISVFNQTVPGYFYRQTPNGDFSNASGCGNELASEREMVRKYIVDSVRFWLEEYHIDGIRFDLMGTLDIETMGHIRKACNQIRPGILLYGEGWTAGQSPLDDHLRATKFNVKKLDNIAVFNDDLRNALKGTGAQQTGKGFLHGKTMSEEIIKFGVAGSIQHPGICFDYIEGLKNAWAAHPSQCINYVSCHDNYTLYDQLCLSLPDIAEESLKKTVKLAGAIILTAQGIPFLHSGQEFMRTKQEHPNSYNAPDSVNRIEWNRKHQFADVFTYYQNLIKIRKTHPAFRMSDANMVRKNLQFCTNYQPGIVCFVLNGKAMLDSWEEIFVVFNTNHQPVKVFVPKGKWQICVQEDIFNDEGINEFLEETINVAPISMLILAKIQNV